MPVPPATVVSNVAFTPATEVHAWAEVDAAAPGSPFLGPLHVVLCQVHPSLGSSLTRSAAVVIEDLLLATVHRLARAASHLAVTQPSAGLGWDSLDVPQPTEPPPQPTDALPPPTDPPASPPVPPAPQAAPPPTSTAATPSGKALLTAALHGALLVLATESVQSWLRWPTMAAYFALLGWLFVGVEGEPMKRLATTLSPVAVPISVTLPVPATPASTAPPSLPHAHTTEALLTERHVIEACRLVLRNELAKHAVSEANKAVARFTNATDASKSAAARAGLQFPVATVGHLLEGCASMPVSRHAAVALAAVCEYMAAEVLELSGNAAKDNNTPITPRCVMLACANDEELTATYPVAGFVGGGVLSCIDATLVEPNFVAAHHQALAEAAFVCPTDEPEEKGDDLPRHALMRLCARAGVPVVQPDVPAKLGALVKDLVTDLVSAAQATAAVANRTDVLLASDVLTTELGESMQDAAFGSGYREVLLRRVFDHHPRRWGASTCHGLVAWAAEPAQERELGATQAAAITFAEPPPAELDLPPACAAEAPVVDKRVRSLATVRAMQRNTEPVFAFDAFAGLVADAATGWTPEPRFVEVVNHRVEGRLVKLLKCASAAALRSHRVVLASDDIDFVRKVCRHAG